MTLLKCELSGSLSPTQAYKLKIHNSVPPTIYRLPKIHKETIPMSPFYNLSKYSASFLANITAKNQHFIKSYGSLKAKSIKLRYLEITI